jgi:eukaryotic-like serine/threonine-protein kinase
MEYCRGGSLQEVFEKGPMNVATARKVATEVTFGLQALHARRMLHRDIKPGNILLDGGGVVKLGDFVREQALGQTFWRSG